MSGTILLLPLNASIAWAEKTLPFTITLFYRNFSHYYTNSEGYGFLTMIEIGSSTAGRKGFSIIIIVVR
jgi:hypothetical protein